MDNRSLLCNAFGFVFFLLKTHTVYPIKHAHISEENSGLKKTQTMFEFSHQ